MSDPDLTPASDGPDQGAASPSVGRRRAAFILGLALLAGASAWFVTSGNRDGGNPLMDTATGAPKLVSGEEMQTIPDEIGHTVFWTGQRPGASIEVSHDSVGNTHVRYLTGDAEAGTSKQTYLDIGTYPFEGAKAATMKLANQRGLTMVRAGAGVGFFDPKRPTSVFLVFSGQPDYQVEVYHPKGDGALDVARSGDIVPMP